MSLDSPDTNFLLFFCDFQFSQFGCTNRDSYLLLDQVMAALHGFTMVISLFYPLQQFIAAKKNGTVFGIDIYSKISLAGLLYHSICCAQLLVDLTILGHFSGSSATAIQVAKAAQAKIILEMLSWIVGGMASNIFILHFVSISSGTDLYAPVRFHGQEFNPRKALFLYRIFVGVFIIASFSNWAVHGPFDQQSYLMERKTALGFLAFVGTFITPIINLFFAAQVLGRLTQPYLAKKQALPPTIQYLRLAIYSVPLICQVPMGFVAFAVSILNELLLPNPAAQFSLAVAAKCIGWFSTTFFSLYLLLRLYESIVKNRQLSAAKTQRSSLLK
ncbi:hypothetical protein HDU91_000471 [Kappamyces sp. JEL0680]|nr:hypothetical protein HDU91_000471 [Kappamyces sp. JEL0680]